MTPEQEVERGRWAEEVLANPVYAEAHGLIAQGITEQWRNSRDAAEREQLHQMLRMLDKVQTLLESTMRTGKVAQAELKRKASLAERIGRLRG